MKKKLLLLFTFTAAFLAGQAQVNLSSSDWPAVNSTATIYWLWGDSATAIADSIDVGAAGASATYDFSDAAMFYGDTTTLDFMDPASLPMGGTHTGAEIGYLQDLNIDSLDTIMKIYAFLDSDTDHLIETGISFLMDTTAFFHDSVTGVMDTFAVVFSADDTLASMNDTFPSTDTEWTMWDLNIGSLFHTESKSYTREVDGWGEFVGPMGSAPALRIKITAYSVSTDSIAGDSAAEMEMDTSRSYEYWGNGQGWMIARVEMAEDWMEIWEVELLNFTPVSIGKYEENNFTIFPNPNAGRFTIRMEKAVQESGTWVIYNAYGQQFASKAMGAGTSEVELQVDGLANGIYYAVLKDSSGQNLAVKKFVRQN